MLRFLTVRFLEVHRRVAILHAVAPLLILAGCSQGPTDENSGVQGSPARGPALEQGSIEEAGIKQVDAQDVEAMVVEPLVGEKTVRGDEGTPSEPERHDLVRRLLQEGQWSEACERIDGLAAEGLASFDEMSQLIHRRGVPRDGAFEDRQSKDEDDLRSAPASPEPLAIARIHFAAGKYVAAMRALESPANPKSKPANVNPKPASSSTDQWLSSAHAAFYGRVLAKQQRFAEMPGWLRRCPDDVEENPDYWTAVAAWHWNHGESELAVGAVLEALERDPTSHEDHLSLQIYLAGDEFASVRRTIDVRYRQILETQSIVNSIRAGRSRASVAEELSKRCLALARPLEAMQWTSLSMDAIERDIMSRGDESELARVRLEHRTRRTLFQRQRLAIAAQPELAVMERRFRRFDLPEERFGTLGRKTLLRRYRGEANRTAESTQDATGQPKSYGTPTNSQAGGFEWFDVAPVRGLSFRYANHTPIVQQGFRLHETLGGGIGVVDYDLDDVWDLYLVQGGGDPPAIPGDQPDRLFRNVGERFADVTRDSIGNESAYGLGVAVGDLNQDGFPDIVVGNLGTNRVLLNQGDGTFRDVSEHFDSPPGKMTTGLAIADVTGDAIVDLIEVNYIDDEAVFHPRPKSRGGTPQGLSPNEFHMAADRLQVQSITGQWQVVDLEPAAVESMIVETGPQSSLGLVVGDFDERPGNEVMVANDARPNRYWVRPQNQRGDPKTKPSDSTMTQLPLVDSAAVVGLARDSTGAATASMGIAIADFDGDHRADVHVTNFHGEASSLYIQNQSSMFVDRSARFQLDGATLDRVGFGTQAADFNQDGWLDLVTLNGHIEDYSSMNLPFRMRPQILAGHAGGFRLVEPEDASSYWEQPHLGRALAKVDFNNDGRMDLVAGHLDRDLALLENRSDAPGAFLRVRCVGTNDERDAIGAKVTVTPLRSDRTLSGHSSSPLSLRSQSQWVVAGGGYLAANDPRLHFVWPDPCERFDVVVRWPSGRRQQLSAVLPNQTQLIVQGSDVFDATARAARR